MPKSKQASLRSSEKRISTEWFHGLDPDEQKSLEQTWRNSTYLLDILKGILQRRLNDLETDKEDDYNNPQWTVLRADRNGQVRQLKKMIDLLP